MNASQFKLQFHCHRFQEDANPCVCVYVCLYAQEESVCIPSLRQSVKAFYSLMLLKQATKFSNETNAWCLVAPTPNAQFYSPFSYFYWSTMVTTVTTTASKRNVFDKNSLRICVSLKYLHKAQPTTNNDCRTKKLSELSVVRLRVCAQRSMNDDRDSCDEV